MIYALHLCYRYGKGKRKNFDNDLFAILFLPELLLAQLSSWCSLIKYKLSLNVSIVVTLLVWFMYLPARRCIPLFLRDIRQLLLPRNFLSLLFAVDLLLSGAIFLFNTIIIGWGKLNSLWFFSSQRIGNEYVSYSFRFCWSKGEVVDWVFFLESLIA